MKLFGFVFFVLALVLEVSQVFSQMPENNFDPNISLLQEVKSFGVEKFSLKIGSGYYKRWSNSEKPYFYVYVSDPDSLKGIDERNYYGYGKDEEGASRRAELSDSLGYSTLIYKTYGTSGAQLSKHLLSYKRVSISFIGFHESIHIHLWKIGSSVPYVYTEALCDLIGVYGSLRMAKNKGNLDFLQMLDFAAQIENINSRINKCISIIESSDTTMLSIAKLELSKVLNDLDKEKDQFLVERYLYELNNAYFLRNRSYTKYYYQLKTLMFSYNSVADFIEFMTNLPSDQEKASLIIGEELLRKGVR